MTIIPEGEFIQRRQRLLENMEINSVAVLSSASEKIRNGGSHYPYRQDSDFLYLTGFGEPEAVLVLVRDHDSSESILFCRPRDRQAEIWGGRRMGPEQAVNLLGVDRAFSIENLDDELERLLDGRKTLFYLPDQDDKLERKLQDCIASLKQKERYGAVAPAVFVDLSVFLHEMRVIKSDAEIAVMEKACDVTVNAHRRAMQVCRSGMFEYELEAEIQHEFMRNGSRSPAYNCIVASGENACMLHYCENSKKLDAGELILIDAGCELAGYAADITRTFPVDGKFSETQKYIYELVLKAQKLALEAIRPGVPWIEPQNIIIAALTEGLMELGILSGTLETLISEKAVLPFYMHGYGHMLGLDTHDAGSLREGRTWRALEPGMVLTVEPGLYIDHSHAGVDKKWKGIGVRIEDNVLVTKDGCRVLSGHLPKTVEEIEALMSEHN